MRTVAPETSKGPALIAFMRQYNWTRVVVLTAMSEVYVDSGLGLTRQLQDAGMEVLKPAAFEPGNFEDATLHDIKQSGFCVVILLAFDVDMQAVASSAQRAQMNSIL